MLAAILHPFHHACIKTRIKMQKVQTSADKCRQKCRQVKTVFTRITY